MPWRPFKPDRGDWLDMLAEAGTVALMGFAVSLAIILVVVELS